MHGFCALVEVFANWKLGESCKMGLGEMKSGLRMGWAATASACKLGLGGTLARNESCYASLPKFLVFFF